MEKFDTWPHYGPQTSSILLQSNSELSKLLRSWLYRGYWTHKPNLYRTVYDFFNIVHISEKIVKTHNQLAYIEVPSLLDVKSIYKAYKFT
jgi:hypothetical protein